MPVSGAPVMCSIVLETDLKYRVGFESFVPNGIVEGYRANFSPAPGKGAPQPAWRRWTGGDWETMQFDLEFRAGPISDGTPADGQNVDINKLASDMEKKVRLIQAMSFPKPDSPRTANQKLLPPAPLIPFVLIIFGDFITYRGYITNTQITWKEPWHPVSARPLAAMVSFSFQPIMAFYPDFYDAQDPQMRGSVVNAISAAERQSGVGVGSSNLGAMLQLTREDRLKRWEQSQQVLTIMKADYEKAKGTSAEPQAKSNLDAATTDEANKGQEFQPAVAPRT